MIYFFYGSDSFRIRQKVNLVIENYLVKHKSGLNLCRFDFVSEEGVAKLKNFMSSYSMFSEKKLAIIENLFETKLSLGDFISYFESADLVKDPERFLVIAQELKLKEERKAKEKYIFKDAEVKTVFNKLTAKSINSEEFDLLGGIKLENWVKKEVQNQNGKIEDAAVKKIAAFVGSDLWQMQNELAKLVSFKNGKPIVEEDVDYLVKSKIESDIFKTIDALAARNAAAAFKFLYRNLAEGESEISLLGILVYQFRNLLLVKSQLESGTQYYGLEKKLKMHPFVLRKTFEQSKNFSLTALKKIYERLMEIDLSIKSGQVEASAALDLVVKEITA